MGTVSGRKPSTVYGKSEGQKFAADTTLIVVSCASCGVTYAIPERFDRSAKQYHGDTENGWSICCPFGHTWHYIGESDLERATRMLNAERDRAATLTARLDQTAASLRGTKARAARTTKELRATKQRVAGGACPCCNRHFAKLEAHMATKHPGYKPE